MAAIRAIVVVSIVAAAFVSGSSTAQIVRTKNPAEITNVSLKTPSAGHFRWAELSLRVDAGMRASLPSRLQVEILNKQQLSTATVLVEIGPPRRSGASETFTSIALIVGGTRVGHVDLGFPHASQLRVRGAAISYEDDRLLPPRPLGDLSKRAWADLYTLRVAPQPKLSEPSKKEIVQRAFLAVPQLDVTTVPELEKTIEEAVTSVVPPTPPPSFRATQITGPTGSQVVGSAVDDQRDVTGAFLFFFAGVLTKGAFSWLPSGFSPLPGPPGERLDGFGQTVANDGLVGGYLASPDGKTRYAAYWTSKHQPAEIVAGLGGSGGASNAIYSCSAAGDCVGASDDRSGVERATAWLMVGVRNVSPIAIGSFPGASGALAINDRAIFGGSFYLSGQGGVYHPYIASLKTKRELFLPAPAGGSGVVLALNDLSFAGGTVTDAVGFKHAALWYGTKRYDLGPKTQPSAILGMNDFGWEVGYVGSPGHTSAALFAGRRVVDLHGAVPGLTLTRAVDVNDNRQILADGIDPQGLAHAVLLTPPR